MTNRRCESEVDLWSGSERREVGHYYTTNEDIKVAG